MSNLQPNYCLKVDFQKVGKHTGGLWLIHDTKRRMLGMWLVVIIPYLRELKLTVNHSNDIHHILHNHCF